MKNYCLLLCFACFVAAQAQIQSFPLTEVLPENAYCYHLPKTVFRITVQTKTIREAPGIYAIYAKRYLGISDIITEKAIHHEIVSVKVSTYTKPDNEKTFYLRDTTPKVSDKAKRTKLKHLTISGNTEDSTKRLPDLLLTKDNILLALNTEKKESSALIPSPFCTNPGNDPFTNNKGPKQMSRMNPPHISDTNVRPDRPQSRQMIQTEEMVMATSISRMAELASKQIFNLRDTRLSMILGEINNMPKDGESMKLYLQELDRLETYYTELFTGARTETLETKIFEYTPENNPDYTVLFRLSDKMGIVDKEDLSGEPIAFIADKLQGNSIVQKADSIVPEKKRSRNDKTAYTDFTMIYYYYPHSSTIQIMNGTDVLFKKDFYVAQFGDLMKLNVPKGSFVEFDPDRGNIIRMGK